MDYYGNNDWRDYLAHYGVKGMRWGKHKYLKEENGRYTYQLGNITGTFGTDKQGAGRTGYKTTTKYLSVGKNNKHYVNVGKKEHLSKPTTYSARTSIGATNKTSTKKIGRISITRSSSGTEISFTKKKNKAKERVDKWLAQNKKLYSFVNKHTAGGSRWTKAISTAPESGVKVKKPLKRKKKVTNGGSGVKRTGYQGWNSNLRRGRKSYKNPLK